MRRVWLDKRKLFGEVCASTDGLDPWDGQINTWDRDIGQGSGTHTPLRPSKSIA